jgi:hypothetical protein
MFLRYGRETFFINTKEEDWLKIPENSSEKKFWSREKAIGEHSKLNNKEFHNLYSSQNIIKVH